MFADSGRNEGDDVDRQNELMTISQQPEPGAFSLNRWLNGPYLDNFDAVRDRLARFRHGQKQGVAVALCDGSGKVARVSEWLTLTSSSGVTKSFAKKYLPRVRISPYGDAMMEPNTQP